MIQQIINFDRPSEVPVFARRPLTVEERFRRFVAENPHVVESIANLARARRRSGQSSFSMRFAFELLRSRVDVAGRETVPGGHRVKINNSYTRLMTDFIEDHYPDLDGFFRTRATSDAGGDCTQKRN